MKRQPERAPPGVTTRPYSAAWPPARAVGALALGAALSSAVFAMGTVNLFDELSKPSGSLSAALVKPSTADPKNQSEAYARDKPGWQASEAKEPHFTQ